MTVTALKPRNTVESLREIVQDLLVPELKSLKIDNIAIRKEMTMGFESVRNEMTMGFESVRNEMALGFESIRTERRLRDEKQTQANQALSDKLAYAIDIRERLAVLEDRTKR